MKPYQTLDELISDLPALALEARNELRGSDGLFCVETKQGRRVYIRLSDGLIKVTDAEAEQPVCRIIADEQTLLAMIRGQLHPSRAILTRKVTIHGDARRLMRLISAIK